jgi:ethanolamine ammonia-lyase large subunit
VVDVSTHRRSFPDTRTILSHAPGAGACVRRPASHRAAQISDAALALFTDLGPFCSFGSLLPVMPWMNRVRVSGVRIAHRPLVSTAIVTRLRFPSLCRIRSIAKTRDEYQLPLLLFTRLRNGKPRSVPGLTEFAARFRIVVKAKVDMRENYVFADLRELFAKANEEKSGDHLAGIAARSEGERVAAKRRLAEITLAEIVNQPLIDPDDDDVTRLILDTRDAQNFEDLAHMTVGAFREWILDDATTETDLKRIQRAVIPEMAAAVAKIMSNKDLILGAAKIRNVTRCRNTMGERGVLGIRTQPNHPVDDLGGILLAAFEGLLYGCGDAVIGVNPASNSVETVSSILRAIDRLIGAYQIPTQGCCLAHITTQLAALDCGAPVDLLFQSVAGTQAANKSFGITLEMLREGSERVAEHHRTRDVAWKGEQVMYFETGQGSALSAEAHHGLDQLTLEARAYGVARAFDPFLVNTVVGFIGPEYLYDERQIIRAGLEDHFMGKLLGLPMGCDVCYTNHAEADQNSADNLLFLLTAAGCNYFMGVPCSDDVMLNYQSTSYHDALAARRLFHLRPAPEFLQWLNKMGIFRDGEPARLSNSSKGRLLRGLESALQGKS